MKTMHRTLLYSVIPLVTPLTSVAETHVNPGEVSKSLSKLGQPTGSSWQASKVIGTKLQTAANEEVGEVQDLIVDQANGEIIAVIVSSGGFLGIADTLSSVPVNAIRYDANAKALKTNLTKEQLQQAPQFKKSDSPDYNDSATMSKLRAYRDSIGGDVSAADNSARNEDEVKKDASDPTSQGNSDADIETTRKIRAAVVDADLSFNTKNIKIITKDGTVTLKGVVKNHAEHEAVLKIAKDHAGELKVTDELKMDEP